MPHGCRWIDFEYSLVPHPNHYGFPAIQTTSIYTDFGPWEEPAHGQRLESSLAVPLLVPIYTYQIMRRYV
jgi:hypothetical protein